jgi:hypothetical protein
MTKLMLLLWGERLPVRDPDRHARLASAGVRRLQVNLDDEPVADALRLQTFDEPVRAVVSAWTADVTASVAALGDAAPRVAGYRVDERRLMESVTTFGADRDLDLMPSSRHLYAL